MNKVIKRLTTLLQTVIVINLGVYSNTTLSQNIPSLQNPKFTTSSNNYAPDRVIVRFKNTTNNANTLRSHSNKTTLQSIGVKLKKRYTFSASKTTQNKSAQAFSTSTSDLQIGILDIVDKSKSVNQIIKELETSGMVDYAEPDYTVTIDRIPNDSRFNELWGLHNIGQSGGTFDADIDAIETWDRHIGSRSIVVGVIDTGVDYTHPDLIGNMWVNTGEIAGNGIDDDYNGYIDDIYGIDVVNSDSDPFDDHSHGTHVSGTIGASGNNSIGVVGVSWNTQIMALKFLDKYGRGSTSGAIELLNYTLMMKSRGVDIRLTNNSWGGGPFSNALSDTILATQNAGMLFIASAGNSGRDVDLRPHYPSGYDFENIISVAASNRNDNLWRASNYGLYSVDIAAPGSNILSTLPGNSFGVKSGTSMASPHISGAAALLWSYFPNRTHLQIKNLILDLADQINSFKGITLSGARLNLNNAINCVKGNPIMRIFSPRDNFRAVVDFDDVYVSVSLSDCGIEVNSAIVNITPSNGDTIFQLLDNGLAPDVKANDGIYTAIYKPINPGSVNLEINANLTYATLSDSINGTIIPNRKYRYEDDHPFNWIDATGGKLLSVSNVEKGFSEVQIGFDFEFYGRSYKSLNVSPDGYLTFGDISGLPLEKLENDPIPSQTFPDNMIAPFWDDMDPSYKGNIYSLLEGTAPNRRLTIAWVGIARYYNIADITFEVTLYEGSNDIVYQYLDTYYNSQFPTLGKGVASTVGIEDDRGLRGLQYLFNEEKLRDKMAILFTYHDAGVSLLNRKYFQFSLPKDPGLNNTVSDIFGNVLEMDTSKVKTWQISEYDHVNRRYKRLTPSSTLEQGKGYYIIHFSGNDIEFKLKGTPTPIVSQIDNPNCPSADGCFEIELIKPTMPYSIYSMMIGTPFIHKVYWRDVRFEIDGNRVCNPAQARANLFFNDYIRNYNGFNFITQSSTNPSDGSAALEPYKGYWIRSYHGSLGKSVKLLVPKGAVSDSPTC